MLARVLANKPQIDALAHSLVRYMLRLRVCDVLYCRRRCIANHHHLHRRTIAGAALQ